jgi:protein-S-isoprenylcysteine O-methyltransferase Ste14
MTPEHSIYAIWILWLVSWTVARIWSSRADKRDSLWAELRFRVLFYLSLVLLFAFPPGSPYYAESLLWQPGEALNWILVAVTAAAILVTWWARICLGALWSDWVVKKVGHHVVNTGPYRFVRHPIYSGLILAAIATAMMEGTLFALSGAALLTMVFCVKARREERFLRTELGEDAYNAYSRRTPMLVPFVRIEGKMRPQSGGVA